MKPKISRPFLWVSLALPGIALAVEPILVRVTADDIMRLRSQNPAADSPAETENHPPALPLAGRSLLGESTILHDGKNWTIIPNGALIHLPAGFSHRVNRKPVGNLMPWRDFAKANESWIATDEVSFEQAAGNEPLSGDKLRQLRTSEKIVVTCHQGGPISIRLEAAPAADEL